MGPIVEPIELLRENIKKGLERFKWSQADLARTLGWTPQEVSNYLRRHEPGLDKIGEFAKAFDVSISEMFSGEGPKPEAKLTPTQREIIHRIRSLKNEELASNILDMLRIWDTANSGLKPSGKDKKMGR